MKWKLVVMATLVLGLLAVGVSTVYAVGGTFPMSTSLTDDKPQSKLWYTDDGINPPTWWGIVGDGSGIYFHKLVGNGAASSFIKQTFPDALVDAVATSRADVLWDGTHLYVLMYKGQTASFYQYTYDAKTQTYTRMVNVPTIALHGGKSESATLAKDSTGRLWIAYDPDTSIRVLWSDPLDHTLWEPTGMSINTLPMKDNDDLAAIVAFPNCRGATSNHCIGVMWSGQASDSLRFRVHRDEALPDAWQTEEVVAQGGQNGLPPLIADDHLNLAVTNDGDILAITKSSTRGLDSRGREISLDELNLFVRRHDVLPPTAAWEKPYAVISRDVNDPNSLGASRPIVVFDQDSRDVYVFYTGRFDSRPRERTIAYKVANLSRLHDLASTAETHLIGGARTGLSVNNVTSTKQNVTHATGVLVVAKGEYKSSTPTQAYYALVDLLALATPTITSFTATPASITSGGSATLAWTTANATYVTITPGGLRAGPRGSVVVSPTTTTYTLTATGPGGQVTQEVTVTVTTPPAGVDAVRFQGR